MEELFIHLLVGIFQCIAEALIEIIGEGVLELIGRGFNGVISGALAENAGLTAIVAVFLLCGSLCGAISLVFFPFRVLHLARLHGIGLIMNPLAAGVACLGWVRPAQLEQKQNLRWQSFTKGFSFILGLTIVRFFLAH